MFSAIKITHAVAGALVLGVGVVSCWYFISSYKAKMCINEIAQATLLGNMIFLLPCGVIQVFTGLYLIVLQMSRFDTIWIAKVAVSFGVAALCWLLGMYLLYVLKNSDDNKSSRIFSAWLAVSAITFLAVFYLMWLMTTHGVLNAGLVA